MPVREIACRDVSAQGVLERNRLGVEQEGKGQLLRPLRQRRIGEALAFREECLVTAPEVHLVNSMASRFESIRQLLEVQHAEVAIVFFIH